MLDVYYSNVTYILKDFAVWRRCRRTSGHDPDTVRSEAGDAAVQISQQKQLTSDSEIKAFETIRR